MMRSAATFFALVVVVWAAVERIAPAASLPVLLPLLAALGALLAPARPKEGGLDGARTRFASALLLPLGVLGARALTRVVLGAPPPGDWLGPLPFLALLLVYLLLDPGAPGRIGRLVGVEAFKIRHARLFSVGLLAAAAMTLLSGFTQERLPETTGWSMLSNTLGAGFWTAEVFLVVLGATAIAGEATGGTLKMMLPHAYRRSDWVIAKATVLGLAAVAFTLVLLAVALPQAAATEGLGDVVQTIEPLFPGDPPETELFATATRMAGYLGARVVLGLAALVTTALLGLLCSVIFESATAALCLAFLLFAGLKFADVLLGVSGDLLERLYGWYPEQVGLLLGRLGRAFSERWDEALPAAGLSLAAVTSALFLTIAIRRFADRDVHG